MSADPAIPEGETGGLLEPNSCRVIWTLKHDFIGPSLGRQTDTPPESSQAKDKAREFWLSSSLDQARPWTAGNPVCLVASAEQIHGDFPVTC